MAEDEMRAGGGGQRGGGAQVAAVLAELPLRAMGQALAPDPLRPPCSETMTNGACAASSLTTRATSASCR